MGVDALRYDGIGNGGPGRRLVQARGSVRTAHGTEISGEKLESPSMGVDLRRLNELRMVRFEDEHRTYAEYVGCVAPFAKDKVLEAMLDRYMRRVLSEDEALQHIARSSKSNLKHFAKLYEYEEGFCKKRAIGALKARYTREDESGRGEVFQCIRRLAHHVSFEFVREVCDDECLALIVGEHARKQELDASFLDGVTEFLPSVFLGYACLNSLLLDTFEEAFARVLERSLEVLWVVDWKDERVFEAISKSPMRQEIFEYVVNGNVVEVDVLERMMGVVGSVDPDMFLGPGIIGRLDEKGIGRYLGSAAASEVVRIGIAGSRCRKLYNALSLVSKSGIERLLGQRGAVDVLLLIVHYDPSTRFGDALEALPASPEREFLVWREREGGGCAVDVDRVSGEIRGVGVPEAVCTSMPIGVGEFRFVGGREGGKREVEEYLEEICTAEESLIKEVRKRLGFRSFLRGPCRPTFDQLLGLPSHYFAEALEVYTNEFLGLLREFNGILVSTSRKRDLVAKRIVCSGYGGLFARYLIKRNRYFGMEVDLDVWLQEMSVEYRIKYFRDHPMGLVGREDEVLKNMGNDPSALLPIVESLRGRNAPKETVGKVEEYVSRLRSACTDGDGAPPDKGGEERKGSKGVKKDSAALTGVRRASDEWKQQKKIKVEEKPEEECVYDDGYPVEKIDHRCFRRRVGFICNEINKRISSGHGLDRVAKVTSMIVRDNEVLERILSVLYGMNRCGKGFGSLVEFLVLFLSYCRMEVEISARTVDVLKRYISEGGSESVLYFVFMKARVEDIKGLLCEFKDNSLDLICKAMCDRACAVSRWGKTGGDGQEDWVIVEAQIEQPVIRRRKEGGVEIDTVMMWDGNEQKERITGLVGSLVHSPDEDMQYVGLLGVRSLEIEMDVEGFLESKSDRIVEAALEVVLRRSVTTSVNDKLMEILYRRGKLDELGKMCLRAINIDVLDGDDAERIYDMFFIDPRNYLEILPRMVERGHEVSGSISLELIKLLGAPQSDEVVDRAIRILRDVEYTDEMVFESIVALENARLASKMFLIEKICRCGRVLDTRSFLKLCVCIGNEDNYTVLRGLLSILRRMGAKHDLVEKWKGSRPLERLMGRIYPLCMEDRPYYEGLLERMKSDRDERMFIDEFYKDELQAS